MPRLSPVSKKRSISRVAICGVLAGAIGLIAGERQLDAANAPTSRRAPTSRHAPTSRPATPTEAATWTERDVISMLASLDPNTTLDSLRGQFTGIVGRYLADLKPGAQPQEIASADGRFVVGVVADAAAGKPGAGVSFEAKGVEFLLVIGGRGGTRQGNAKLNGGDASASAPDGIAIAIGGAGTAGGRGGNASAHGHLDSIAVLGPGVNGLNGMDDNPAGRRPLRIDGIVAAARAWNDKK